MNGLHPTKQILCLGLGYRTAPVELRERLNYTPAILDNAFSHLRSQLDLRPNGIHELAILSTCNRLEFYAAVSAHPLQSQHPDPFAPLVNLIVETRGLSAAEFETRLYRHTSPHAVEHLCRVASGLDSMILGEPQILGQVADAYEAALRHRAVGPVLSALFRTAIRAGKRARTETAISRNPASISSMAVKLAEQVIYPLAGCRVAVVGAGEMGELAIEALRARGAGQITVVNRTPQRALELADRLGACALGFGQLAEAIRDADIVIVSTGAPHTIIGPEMVRDAMTHRQTRPLVLIDIAVPRNVDAAVREIAGAHLFDIDQLYARLENAVNGRQSEIPHVEAIVAQEVSNFEAWSRGIEIMPTITDLRTKAEHIRQRELDRTLRHLPNLDPETRKHIEHLSESLINKLLHEPTRRLRAQAGNDQAAEYAQAVRHLFDLGD